MGFKQEKFKKLIEHKSGYTWGKEQELDKPEDGTVRVLTVTNIQEELDLSNELYLKDVKDRDKKEKGVSKDWTIAVSSNGNRKRIGNAVFVSDDTDYLFASFLTAFKPNKEADIIPEYFFQWFSSHVVQERITSVSEGTTGLGNLDIRYLRNMVIEYPDNEAEQKAIATILSKVDEAIKATENSIRAAEKLKKSLMQNLLTGKLKPDGTQRKEEEFYKDEKFGNVPVGWKIEKLKRVFKLKNGKGNPTNNLKDLPDDKYSIPVFGGNGITGYFDTPFLSQPTLIIGRVGEYCGSVYKTPDKCWVTDNALWISEVFEEAFDLDFWYYLLINKGLNQYSDATGQPKITQSGIGNLKIIYPDNGIEQKEIASKILDVDLFLKTKEVKIRSIKRLKKSLMQNLLTGKVQVDLNKIEKSIANETV
jgi:type I restriction enzyme S subunit